MKLTYWDLWNLTLKFLSADGLNKLISATASIYPDLFGASWIILAYLHNISQHPLLRTQVTSYSHCRTTGDSQPFPGKNPAALISWLTGPGHDALLAPRDSNLFGTFWNNRLVEFGELRLRSLRAQGALLRQRVVLGGEGSVVVPAITQLWHHNDSEKRSVGILPHWLTIQVLCPTWSCM